MKRMMTLIAIILGLLLIYYTIVLIASFFDGIVQGDLLGLVMMYIQYDYIFDEVIDQQIIIAPPTLYAADDEMKDAYVINDIVDMEIFK